MEKKIINQNKEYKVPSKFKPILIDLIKEILINQHEDIISFCADHFKNKQEQLSSNLNRVTTFPIPENKNDITSNAFQKKFVSQNDKCLRYIIYQFSLFCLIYHTRAQFL